MATFGLQIPNFTFDGPPGELFDRVADLAEAAEATGYKSVWVMDHFFQLPALGGPDQPMLEAYTLLGALAACTDAVELGALVTGVTYRNPAILAKQVTTLDIISKGRAVLGLGAAWYDVEHHALGVEYPPDGVRLDMLEEALQICRAMFTQERSSFDGRHFTTKDARNIPAPLRPGGPRILVGGGGEKRTLRLVAKYADACNVNAGGATLRRKIDVLREHCADVGRDPAEVRVTPPRHRAAHHQRVGDRRCPQVPGRPGRRRLRRGLHRRRAGRPRRPVRRVPRARRRGAHHQRRAVRDPTPSATSASS